MFFASDGLHPTSAAYRLCFECLQAETCLFEALDEVSRASEAAG